MGHWCCLEEVEHTTIVVVEIRNIVGKCEYHLELWRKFLVEAESDVE